MTTNSILSREIIDFLSKETNVRRALVELGMASEQNIDDIVQRVNKAAVQAKNVIKAKKSEIEQQEAEIVLLQKREQEEQRLREAKIEEHRANLLKIVGSESELEDVLDSLTKRTQSRKNGYIAPGGEKYILTDDQGNIIGRWSGRGKRPHWVNKILADGRNVDEFLNPDFNNE